MADPSAATTTLDLLAASGPLATVLGVAVYVLWKELQAERRRAAKQAEKWENFILAVNDLLPKEDALGGIPRREKEKRGEDVEQ